MSICEVSRKPRPIHVLKQKRRIPQQKVEARSTNIEDKIAELSIQLGFYQKELTCPLLSQPHREKYEDSIEDIQDCISILIPECKIFVDEIVERMLFEGVKQAVYLYILIHPTINLANKRMKYFGISTEYFKKNHHKKLSLLTKTQRWILNRYSRYSKFILATKNSDFLKNKRELTFVYQWFLQEESMDIFSFRTCCEWKNLDFNATRQVILNLSSQNLSQLILKYEYLNHVVPSKNELSQTMAPESDF